MDGTDRLEARIAYLERRLASLADIRKEARQLYQIVAKMCLARGQHPSYIDKAQVMKDRAQIGNHGWTAYLDACARLERIGW